MMPTGANDVVPLSEVTWHSPPLAMFDAMASTVEARFGPPSSRDVESGVGLFDCHCLRFVCGLEIVLWRFHQSWGMRAIDPRVEPSMFEVYANSDRDLAHLAFHLGVPIDTFVTWTNFDDTPTIATARADVIVMRTDDNGIEAEVTRVTSRCEAEALVRMYEARAHKQTYWIAR